MNSQQRKKLRKATESSDKKTTKKATKKAPTPIFQGVSEAAKAGGNLGRAAQYLPTAKRK